MIDINESSRDQIQKGGRRTLENAEPAEISQGALKLLHGLCFKTCCSVSTIICYSLSNQKPHARVLVM